MSEEVVLHPAEISERAQAFWKEWQGREEQFAALSAQEFVEQGNDFLHEYLDGAVLELESIADQGSADSGLLVFSANGIVQNFPQVEALVRITQTQAQTKRYTVQAFRQRVSQQLAENFAIGMGGFNLSVDEVLLSYALYDQRIDIALSFTKEIEEEYVEHARHMSFIMLDHILGEWNFAVKIGGVDFVERHEGASMSLAQFVQKIEHIWQKELQHTGLYPEPEWQYGMYECEEDEAEERDALVLIRNQSASSLLGRADMAWCVIIHCDVGDDEDLENARALEDDFYARIEQHQHGIGVLSMMNMTRSTRSVFAYCSDAEHGERMATQSLAAFPKLQGEVVIEYDPTWSHYRF